jgi:hypothetical protein
VLDLKSSCRFNAVCCLEKKRWGNVPKNDFDVFVVKVVSRTAFNAA